MKKLFSFWLQCICGLMVLITLNACIIGGTGTDTPNGLNDPKNELPSALRALSIQLVDSAGHGVQGITVNLIDTGYRPELKKKPISLVVDSSQVLVSDSTGTVSCDLVKGGIFVLTGSINNAVVIFDTVKIANPKGAALLRFALRKTHLYQGKVKLTSGLKVDSGMVFIQGTERFAKVDSLGNYNLGTLPIDAAKMAVGLNYSASPTTEKIIAPAPMVTQLPVDTTYKPVVVGDTSKKIPSFDTTKQFIASPIYTCKDAPKDSSRVVAPSNGAGIVTSISSPFTTTTLSPTHVNTPVDTGRVNTVLKACGSIPNGSVVTLTLGDTSNAKTPQADAPTQQYLVTAPTITSGVEVTNKLVSYSNCIQNPGSDKTTFQLQFLLFESSSDLVVSDLSSQCTQP